MAKLAKVPPVPFRPRALAPLSAGLVILGGRRAGLRDVYYFFVSGSWWRLLGAFVVTYLTLNLLFGAAFLTVGGVQNATPDSFADHFFFSVQTFATIGYGAMFPTGLAAHLLVTVESMLGLMYVAVGTGLVFAKFSRPRARVLFSSVAVITPRNGVPTLMFRAANERNNHIVEAQMKVAILRTEDTLEGERIRRIIDLPLVRSQTPVFTLSWTVMHSITPDSPLYGATPESLAAQQAEFIISLTGMDAVMGQSIHARHSLLDTDLVWNARLVDILRTDSEGRRVMDYTRFNEVEPLPDTNERATRLSVTQS
ncbi:ion channel [Vitiosangium sp. GDMCC 1.1324]|uniref:ion channel n=1 Tax=Vitiosangium sp. (strain GDMCC 1.1324) TaxID=2138576 RepID=UPI000D388318|nr:ion channel [Vitiosangium sp. GDMCC 1.1324]PTL82973.1 ATP-sensitive inward rectifier potassium channel 10 [Vitiosangium sp. GDMCC 1.1324]